MLLKSITVPAPVTLAKEDPVGVALSRLAKHRLPGAPVLEDGRVEGVLDLFDALAAPVDAPVAAVMKTDFPRLKTSDPVDAVISFIQPAHPVVDEAGFYAGVVSQQALSALLRNSANRSRHRADAILECVHNGILAIDVDGIVTMCNKAAGRLLDIEPEELIGRSVNDIVPMNKCILPRVIDTGRPEFSRKIVIKGRTMVSNHTPLVVDGVIAGATAVFQDITELERVSSELNSVRQLYNQLDTIIESSFDGIMVTDSKGHGVRINKALARLTGLDESHFVGKPIEDLFKTGIFGFESITIKALKEGRIVTGVQYILPTNKEVIVTGTPIFDQEGRIAWVLTNVRDVTELNNLKEKLRQSQILTARYHAELSQLLVEKLRHDAVIAESKEMLKVLQLAVRAAQVDSTVLITGESGVGKEVVARIIHNAGERAKQGNLIQINCGAIPENLLEAELFGYEPGAFTGCRKQGKMGLFELANKGTVLLDEIAEMPLNLQVKLLRFLQEQEVYRLGGTKPIKLDVRVIAATNKDLWACVQQGLFREDLFYRVNVIPIAVPPLRQRREDIVPLTLHFLKEYKARYGVEKRLEPKALAALEDYPWPGNVRELENFIERLGALYEDNLLSAENVVEQLYRSEKRLPPVTVNHLIPLKDAQEIVEKELLSMALSRCKTTRRAADALGIAHSSVVRKAARYNLKAVQLWTTKNGAGGADEPGSNISAKH
ncbi:MAG: sigma 54-interacting transcriptional regulator [Firmicutes bacterium]|nr:sigma 54-interacting transcriptional regulator [Bacillota bacterium]